MCKYEIKNKWIYVLNCGLAVLSFNGPYSSGLTDRSLLDGVGSLKSLTKVVCLWLGIHLFFQPFSESF